MLLEKNNLYSQKANNNYKVIVIQIALKNKIQYKKYFLKVILNLKINQSKENNQLIKKQFNNLMFKINKIILPSEKI